MPPKKSREQKIKEKKPTAFQLKKQEEEKQFKKDLEEYNRLMKQNSDLYQQCLAVELVLGSKYQTIRQIQHQNSISFGRIQARIAKGMIPQLLIKYPELDIPIVEPVRPGGRIPVFSRVNPFGRPHPGNQIEAPINSDDEETIVPQASL